VDDGADLAAGDFSWWATMVRGALRGEGGSEVPCGSCTACCTSSQFIHIGPDETDTLARIPPELLFPAPRLPAGHVVLGYDQHGRCPMFVDQRCSVYEHRPRACRAYDCRVFPATGLAPDADDETKAAVGRQARRWRFSFPTEADRRQYAAVRAAATFLQRNAALLPHGSIPTNPTQLAVLAIELAEVFLGREAGGDPDMEEVRVELTRRRPTSP
jgi:Fe-S-cluster containining protein